MDHHVEQVANHLARLAAGLHESAAQLGRTGAVAWSSLAADRFRAALAEAGGRVLVAAGQTEQAAAAMSRHAEALRAGDGFLPVGRPW
jgi:hypothetical protein